MFVVAVEDHAYVSAVTGRKVNKNRLSDAMLLFTLTGQYQVLEPHVSHTGCP